MCVNDIYMYACKFLPDAISSQNVVYFYCVCVNLSADVYTEITQWQLIDNELTTQTPSSNIRQKLANITITVNNILFLNTVKIMLKFTFCQRFEWYHLVYHTFCKYHLYLLFYIQNYHLFICKIYLLITINLKM